MLAYHGYLEVIAKNEFSKRVSPGERCSLHCATTKKINLYNLIVSHIARLLCLYRDIRTRVLWNMHHRDRSYIDLILVFMYCYDFLRHAISAKIGLVRVLLI